MEIKFLGIKLVDDQKFQDGISSKAARERTLQQLRHSRKLLLWAEIFLLLIAVLIVLVGIFLFLLHIILFKEIPDRPSMDIAIYFLFIGLSNSIILCYVDLQIKIIQMGNNISNKAKKRSRE